MYIIINELREKNEDSCWCDLLKYIELMIFLRLINNIFFKLYIMKTIVIILGETRTHELTFENFKKNVFDVLNADLCLCIGVKPHYDYENPFYKLAKYKFLYNEDEDYSGAFDYAYNLIEKPKYEVLNNINALHNKIQHPKQSTDNITYYGTIQDNINNLLNNNFNDDEIVINTNNCYLNDWKNQIYGIKNSDNNNLIIQNDIITLKKPLNWREFLKIKDQFHLQQNNVEYLIKEFPYVMYTCRNHNGTTRWSLGLYSEQLGYYIKYLTEYNQAEEYLIKFNNSGLTIDEFYKDLYD